MEKLSKDWFSKGIIDLEYKQYVLLGYLKKCREKFDRTKLYPQFSDLVMHYHNLLQFKEKKKVIYDKFPKNISKIDFAKLKLQFEQEIQDSEVLREVSDLVEYAISEVRNVIEDGKEIYDFVQSQLTLDHVGVIPLYDQEGYLLLNLAKNRNVHVYQYNTTVFESSIEKYRGINFEYVGDWKGGIGNTYENIKLDLVKTRGDLPNPATFVVHSSHVFPVEATVLPIAKRKLIQKLAA